MKAIVAIIRIVVGVLFIISGFVKLNDPVGFSYKLQEYFSPSVLNLEFLSPYALGLAIIIVIVELVLGIALLIGYYKKTTLGLLLLMIVFFSFLTFYSAYYNKVTDCGCFGDALPLTPWQSFAKDVLLLLMILVLIVGRDYIKPLFSRFGRTLIIFFSFIASLSFGYYVLMHLPLIDFRAYHEGVNIPEGMQVPEDAPEAIFEYKWKFEIDGEERIITTRGDYPQSKGTFKGVETKMIQEGYIPPIHDFSISKDGKEFTEQFLNTTNLLIVVAYDITKTEWNGWPKVKKLTDEALKKGYTVIGLTASGEDKQVNVGKKQKINFEFYTADATTLKTIIRSNPGIVKLKKGTIIQKKHWNDLEEIVLENNLPSAKPNLDLSLKYQLDTIARLDKQYFHLAQLEGAEREKFARDWGISFNDTLVEQKDLLDAGNFRIISKYIKQKGYPGKDTVGSPTSMVALEIIKDHPEEIPKYIEVLKKAGREGQIPLTAVAHLEDYYLMLNSRPQRYGTQAVILKDTKEIWPIEDPKMVDIRRKIAGFSQDLEAYAKDLIGAEYSYIPKTIAELQDK